MADNFTLIVDGSRGIQGASGLNGKNFEINHAGLLSAKSIYNDQVKGFSFLATDTGYLYIKNSNANADWSEPVLFTQKGEQGIQGLTGADGKSAYDVWTSNGNVGTEEEFLLSLKGNKGEQGDIGQAGATGSTGETGATGIQGSAATIAVGTVATGNAGTEVQIKNSGTSSAAVLDFVIPKGDPGADGTGTGDMLASIYDPVIKSITGKTSGTANADVSLATLFNQTDTKSALIPVGYTYDLFRADRNQTYNYLYVDCHDSTGTAQNPTSLVVTMYVNGALVYTSPAITTAAFTATLALTINAGDLVRVVTSNTTGLTGGVLVSPRMVNR